MTRAPERPRTDPIAAARELAETFREHAAERDLERRFPHEELQLLRRSGLGALLVPVDAGGMGCGSRELVRVLSVLAEGDPSIAQMYLIHTYGVALVAGVHCDEDVRLRYFRRIADEGMLITNAFSETSGRTVLDYSVTFTPTSEGNWRVDGRKGYCTGSLGGDALYVLGQVTGAGPEPSFRMGLVEVDAPGLTIVDDWTGMGQRTTASGTIEFRGVPLPGEACFEIDHFNTPESLFGSLGQCMFSAIFLGIARDALRDAVEYVRTRTRPWPHAIVERAVDDPYVVETIGEMRIAVSTADSMLERAIDVREEAEAAPSAEARDRASVAAAEAKVVTGRAALDLSQRLFSACGTGSVVEKYGFDRHWRNARTLTLHDPMAYKVKLVGDYVLGGVSPPISVYT